jgi:hypothetical protein
MEDLIRNAHTLFDDRLSPSPPAEVVSVRPTSVAEWRVRAPQSQLAALTVPQSPPETVLPSTLDFLLSSATSLQTRMGRLS